MNYRHAFHAGNFADCMKHALLVRLVCALQRKPAPLFILDTHAGVGRYDLMNGPAERTGEWRKGIARLIEDPPTALADYVSLVKSRGMYPGSPALIRSLLRPGDRLVCCELHSEDADALRHNFSRDHQVSIHHRDGWEALGALVPPRERRGLILIDPPFEEPQEFAELTAGLAKGYARFRTGVFAAWYPIKHRAPVRSFFAQLHETGIRDVIAAELCLREPIDPARLNGCGVLLINPPYRFEQEVAPILAALLDRLGNREPGEATTIVRLADE
jgi:23S rRNA (adenine2030-N6)-methyltransferase